MPEVFNVQIFKQAYQKAMAEKAPTQYREAIKNRTIKEIVTEAGEQAQLLYQETVEKLQNQEKMGDEAKHIATEIVFNEMIQF